MKMKFAAICSITALIASAAVSCGSTVQKAGQNPVQNSTSASTITTEVSGDTVKTDPVRTTDAAVKPTDAAEQIMRGNIYDDKGVLLMSSHRENGREVRSAAPEHKIPMANLLWDMSEGFDLTFDKLLRTPNPTPADGNEKIGQSIKLTVDSAAQDAIYEYMQAQNIQGAVVVMRTDGSIMAEVSYPSYDPDDYYGKSTDEDLAWGTYGNKAFQNAEPGSVFKIMSEIIADKHGVYSQYDDGTWDFGGTPIVNWDHDTNPNYPVPDRSLYSAFINSSNIFFAKTFDQIGADAVLSDLDEHFSFGKNIDCDFGTLHNNIEIYCDDDLRRTAFGQSYVLTCPIYIAAMTNDAIHGSMARPFVLKEIVDTNDSSLKLADGSKSGDIVCSIPEQCRDGIRNCMAGVGSDIGVYPPAGYQFYGKTGTAETWMGDFLYITGCICAPSDDLSTVHNDYSNYNGSYVVTMQIRNGPEHGFSFASESAWLYQGIVNTIFS